MTINVETSASFTKLKTLDKFVDCYVLKTKKKSKFIAWWTTIKWFYNNEEKSIRLRKKILWKSQKKAFHWKQYYKKAIITKNVSKVICRRCFVVLNHFFIDIENSVMYKHLTSINDLKTSKKKSLIKLSIKLEYRTTCYDAQWSESILVRVLMTENLISTKSI